MQHQSSLVMTPMQGQLPPTANIGTEVIQKYLDENRELIMAILDNQNLGKLHECAQYQARLQSNLMYLAAIADAQPQISTQNPQMISGSHPMQHPVQFMQQQQQQQQQQQADFSPSSCQQFQEQQAQQYQLNHLQMQSHMGMSAANNNGLHVMRSDGGGVGSFDRRGNNTNVSESGSLEVPNRNSAVCSDAENN